MLAVTVRNTVLDEFGYNARPSKKFTVANTSKHKWINYIDTVQDCNDLCYRNEDCIAFSQTSGWNVNNCILFTEVDGFEDDNVFTSKVLMCGEIPCYLDYQKDELLTTGMLSYS